MSFLTKIFDPLMYASGREILRVTFWCHVMILAVFWAITATFRFYQWTYENETTLILNICRWSVNAYMVVFRPILIYCLWKGIQKQSKQPLKMYIVMETISIFPSALLILYAKNSVVFGKSPVTFLTVMDTIVCGSFVLMGIFSILVVLFCFLKLNSPVMMKLYEHWCYLQDDSVEGSESEENSRNAYAFLKNICDGLMMPKIDPELFKKYIISPWDMKIDNKAILGEGQFGLIYKGTFLKAKCRIPIAAKVAKNPSDSPETFTMLMQEIKIMIYVGDHENTVKFHGVTSDASVKEHFAIINEFCSMGSLECFLQQRRHTFINLMNQGETLTPSVEVLSEDLVYVNLTEHGTHSTKDLLRFATEIARGMEHLASKKVIHGDLAARNILLTANLTAKLTDFGMSRRLYNYQAYLRIQEQQTNLPWRWMSIEAIEDLKFSEESDVWGYGVTLWEIFSLGDFPFPDLKWEDSIPNQIRNGLRLQKPSYADNQIYDLMMNCWDVDYNKRPSFTKLRRTFENISSEN